MLIKNLLIGYRKFFVFVFFVSLSFFLLSTPKLNVWGQESAEVTVEDSKAITNVENFKAEDFDSEDALLFVQGSSLASESILEYIEQFRSLSTENFQLYVVEVPTSGDIFAAYKELYDQTCGAESFVVPTMIYKENCILGYDNIATDLAIRFKLVQENAKLKDSLEQNVAELDTVVEEVNAEIESKTFFDWVSSLDTLTLVGIGGAFVIGIAIVVLLIVFRDKLRGKKKIVSSIVPVLVLVSSIGYLVYTVNDAQKDFSPLESSAGCIQEGNCGTWAERVADGIASGGENSEQIQKYTAIQEQMVKDEELFGSNAAHIVADVAYKNSTLLSAVYKLPPNSTFSIDGTSYTYKNGTVYTSDGKPIAISKVFENVIRVDQVSNVATLTQTDINLFVSASGGTVTEGMEEVVIEQEKAKYTTTSDGSYCLDSKNTIISCPDSACSCGSGGGSDITCCEGVSKTLASKFLDFKYDASTGTVVIVPTGKAILDPCVGGLGNNITAKLLCECDKGIWTSAYTGTCDSICRVEWLSCDDCNPPEPGQPEIQSGEYCGDGILGNTTGEVCEYGDPSGVQCSWNVCGGDCTCPDIAEPYCGDGTLDSGEQCEVGDPSGAEYTWDECNHVTCKYVAPGCGDGVIDEGETCERGDPTDSQCLWDTECNQLLCSCKVEQLPSCGDGTLDEGESCELGNPSGSECDWNQCSKYTCSCPTPGAPKTGIFDDGYLNKVIIGAVLLVLGLIFQPAVSLINHSYIKISGSVITIGRKIEEKKVSERREKIEKRFR